MKKGIVCVSIVAISIMVSSGLKSFNIANKPFNNNNQSIEIKAAERVDYTIQEFCDFLNDKREHYPLSDEFIERYQQASGGYIDYAKQCGIPVDKYNHSPNQKWHFFSSWIEYGEIDKTGDAYTRVYVGLKCPELLLWIYEAMGVDPAKVKKAKDVAEAGRASNTNVSTIAKNMRAEVTWEDLIVEISKK